MLVGNFGVQGKPMSCVLRDCHLRTSHETSLLRQLPEHTCSMACPQVTINFNRNAIKVLPDT